MKASTAVSGWWPNQLNLKPLKGSDPTYDYAKEFASLDLDAVKATGGVCKTLPRDLHMLLKRRHA